ncbi:2-phospho-L-lactate guanylyltransferase [Tomitella fengzijianii]|uniref:Phosphoenolpyruvate guanylyltransferase n=1 Tax=Tomitella fengzijianii TaxID=2597660 RepID=A0A516X3S1_9ACTN|nr:2-phospho-L-lactate guanylyltransferase [Tomitella fengzijianii]QDQ97732.1 2-phospho-L-lactate guanylyltransferase [Tomitella fengzijianii]
MTTRAAAFPGVHVIVPVKNLAGAKSRLTPGIDESARRGLVLAMLEDTLRSLSASPAVSAVTVVTPDAAVAAVATRCGACCVDEQQALIRATADGGASGGPRASLNAALTGAAYRVRDAAAPAHLAFVQADLPSLRPGEFTAAAASAIASAAAPDAPAGHGRAYIADRSGDGTTAVFVSGATTRLRLAFGTDSSRRHAAQGAVALHGSWPGLRADVDTVADLHHVRRLGTGTATAAMLRRIGVPDTNPR